MSSTVPFSTFRQQEHRTPARPVPYGVSSLIVTRVTEEEPDEGTTGSSPDRWDSVGGIEYYESLFRPLAPGYDLVRFSGAPAPVYSRFSPDDIDQSTLTPVNQPVSILFNQFVSIHKIHFASYVPGFLIAFSNGLISQSEGLQHLLTADSMLMTPFQIIGGDFYFQSGTATLGTSQAPTQASGRAIRLEADLNQRRATLRDWEDEDGTPPNDRAFDEASHFIGVLPLDVPDPSIYVSGDAEVGFSWMLPDGFVEVAFRGDGNIRYAFRFEAQIAGDVTSFVVDGTPSLPLELRRALAQLR